MTMTHDQLHTHGPDELAMLRAECDKWHKAYDRVWEERMRFADRAIELEKENKELKEERRWRKCSEELPSHDTWCLVYHEGEIDVDHYTDDCNSHDRFVMYGFYVTHWMPLPKAPETAEKFKEAK